MNAILKAWIDGCAEIRKVWGGYDFYWIKGNRIDVKELRAGQVCNRSWRGIPFRVDETTMPIDIGVMDIIKASVYINRSGKLVK